MIFVTKLQQNRYMWAPFQFKCVLSREFLKKYNFYRS